jgi:hypothetical protein
MNNKLLLFFILIASLAIPIFFKVTEPFSLGNLLGGNLLGGNVSQENQSGENQSQDLLLQDTFPLIGNMTVSDKQFADVWWKYPIFKVGSYAQITNNIKYPRNPDTGRCMRIEMCDALYDNRENKSNVVVPYPPVESSDNPRVGYFNTSM